MKTPNMKSLFIICTLSALACSETEPPNQVRDAYLATDQSPPDASGQPADSNMAADFGISLDANLGDAAESDMGMPLDGQTIDPDSSVVDVCCSVVPLSLS